MDCENRETCTKHTNARRNSDFWFFINTKQEKFKIVQGHLLSMKCNAAISLRKVSLDYF
jgi:hypothetical protein